MEENTQPTESTEQVAEQPPVETKGQERHKSDLAKYKEQAKVLAEENAKLAKAKAELEEQTLKEKSNYKALWERSEAEKKALLTKVETIDRQYVDEKKTSLLEREALSLGLDPKHMDYLKYKVQDAVQVEYTSLGNINVLGAKDAVEEFRMNHPELFKTNSRPNINSSNPGSVANAKVLSPNELLDLQKKDPQAYNREYKRFVESKRK